MEAVSKGASGGLLAASSEATLPQEFMRDTTSLSDLQKHLHKVFLSPYLFARITSRRFGTFGRLLFLLPATPDRSPAPADACWRWNQHGRFLLVLLVAWEHAPKEKPLLHPHV